LYQVREKERKIIWLIILDQATKLLALQKGIAVINKKAALGLILPFNLNLFFLGLVIYFYFFKKQGGLGLWLILVGGVSNLIDRLIRGGVVDFISLPLMPLFNLADVFICLGAGLFFIDSLRKIKVS